MLKDKLNKISNFIGEGLVKKFVISIVLIIILLGVLTTILVQINLSRTLSEELQERGMIMSRELATSSVDALLTQDRVHLQRHIENIMKTEKEVKYIYITDRNNNVVVHTFKGGFPNELLSINSTGTTLLDTGEGKIVQFTSPILGGRAGFVHIGMDESSMEKIITQTSHAIIVLTLMVGIFGIFLAYITGNYLTRPILALVKGTEEIGRGNLGYKIETKTSDEVHILSEAFNQMSCNLEKSISALRTSEERYRKLVDGIGDAVILIDPDKRILSWNKAARGIFGMSFEEVSGCSINILCSSPAHKRGDEELSGGERTFIKKDGSTFPGYMSVKPLQESLDTGDVVVIRDISDLKEKAKLEKQLMQSDKLATIGQLASGVAHEINNPLANISLYTEMLLKKADDGNTKDKLTIINDEAHRAAHIVKGLLEFARQSEPKLGTTYVNNEINKVVTILGYQFKNIEVKTFLEPLMPISADSRQIQQVLMNLLTNSIQSIRNTKDGQIIIRTRTNSNTIEIDISDNGCGIHEKDMDKIFDPFFTTKGDGEGTGLGLSMCYGIIQRHNGSIEVESKVGRGTTFTIKLPM